MTRELSFLLGCVVIVVVGLGGCRMRPEATGWEIVIDGPTLIDEAGLSSGELWWVSAIPDTVSDGVWVFAPAPGEASAPPHVLLCSTTPKRILRVLNLEVPEASAPDEWLAGSFAVDSTGNIYVAYVRGQEWRARLIHGEKDVQFRHRLVVFDRAGVALRSVDILFPAEPNDPATAGDSYAKQCSIMDMVVIGREYVGLLWEYTILNAPWNWIELRSSNGESLWTVRAKGSELGLFDSIGADPLETGVLLAENGGLVPQEGFQGCTIARFDREGQSLPPYRPEGWFFVGSDRRGHLYTIESCGPYSQDYCEVLRSDVNGRILERVTLPTFAEDSLEGWSVSLAGDLYVWGWGEGENGDGEPENFAIWRHRGSGSSDG